MAAYLIVRAEVPEADREAFDRWYESEHLPDVKAAFEAEVAFRGWRDEAPSVHFAIYRFPSLERIQGLLASPVTERLIAEFDRVWQGRVTRSREVFGVAQTL